jgi:hypothetical protein
MQEQTPEQPELQVRKPKTKEFWKLAWDTGWGFVNLSPLGSRLWKEGGAVKRYPVLLVISLILVGFGSWYGTRLFYASPPPTPPYDGETNLKLFFPGKTDSPQLMEQHNVYRWTCFRGDIHANIATVNEKKEPVQNVADIHTWVIFILFEHDVDYDIRSIKTESTMQPQPSQIAIKECGRRGISIVMPETPSSGSIDFKLEKVP